jgi:hypothetical protein
MSHEYIAANLGATLSVSILDKRCRSEVIWVGQGLTLTLQIQPLPRM